MAAASRGTGPAVGEQLAKDPQKFSFFQAVRLLEHMARERCGDAPSRPREAIGRDCTPTRESVRFRALPSHTFPPCEVHSLSISGDPAGDPPTPLAEMTVSFMGLFGPSGVLPQHYTQLVIDRVRHKDRSLQDFLDVFNHRAVSLFFRAWQKYRLPVLYEEAACSREDREDLFTSILFSLIGWGPRTIRGRLEVDDAAFVHYSGHFSHYPRTVAALESIVGDYFQIAVTVQQFQGQWLYLDPEDQSRMPAPGEPDGRNCRLGLDVVVGSRVWSIENRFRLRLGPVSYRQFQQLMPSGNGLLPLCQLVRTYAGPECDFDVQPMLVADEVPWCRAGGSPDEGSFLGWNTWLRSRPMNQDAEEAVFVNDGYPITG